jgi:isopenicillin-N epimerase
MTILPALGSVIRHEWALAPGYVTVNHGSFGATPKSVLAAQQGWRDRMEAQPSRFFRSVLPGALREAASALATFLGAAGQDLGFVANATEGCNAVLRSLAFAPGDEILVLGHVYGTVRNTVRYVASRQAAVMVEAPIPFPRPDDETILANVAAAITPRTRLAVIDHITSSSALVLPLAAIIAACHARGVPGLVDGAHGPGQVTLDLPALDADWYVGNCHKWLNAAKGCGFLWARRDRQADLHPAVISHGYEKGFLAEFDWTGTYDPSAQLSITAALAFHARFGGAAMRARNAALAAEAAAMVAARFGTETGHGNQPTGAMAMVRLPVTAPMDSTAMLVLRDALLEAGTDVPLHLHGGRPWLRLSAQAYNELDDYARMADIVLATLR